MQIAERLSEAGLEEDAKKLIKIAISYQEAEDKLAGYADEVETGATSRKVE